MVTVVRGQERVDMDNGEFRKIVQDRQLQPTDWISCTDGRFHQAREIAAIKPYLPAQESLGDALAKLFVGAVVVAGVVCAAGAVISAIDEATRPKTRRRRVYFDEPLTQAKRREVRERDDETCQYCGCHAPDGHVDHERSRADGGTNRIDNLVWACIPCNTRKGRDSASQFRRRMGF